MEEKRAQYLAICQTCLKSNFDRKKGLVCTLTNEHAAFDLNEDCPDYTPEEKAIKRQEATTRRKLDHKEEQKGLLSSKVGIGAGIVLMIAGIVGFIIGLSVMGRILVLPILLVVFGIVAISRGSERKLPPKKAGNEDLLDDEII